MATSGSFNTNAIGNFYTTFNWNRVSYDSSASTSKIAYSVVAHNTPGNYRTVYEKNLTIAGQDIELSNSGQTCYDETVIASGEITIQHADDGTGSFSASFSCGVGITPGTNSSGGDSWEIDTIPRYSNITEYYVSSTGLKSITVKWNAYPYVDKVEYSLNDGSWTNNDYGYSTYIIIPNLEPNTKYKIKIRIRSEDSGLWTESEYQYATTKDIAKMTLVPNFTDEDSPIIQYSNPAGNDADELKICINCGGGVDIPYRDISKTGSNYTFNFTDSERETLRNMCTTTTSKEVKFVLATIKDGVWYYHDVYKTLSIINANPTFNHFEYEDRGAVSLTLTENNKTVIRAYNVLRLTVPVANRAMGNKNASIVKYRAVCGNIQTEVNYSNSSDVIMTLSYVLNNTLTVYAIDSRGNSTAKTIAVDKFIPYEEIKITNAKATRTNGVGSETTLFFEGQIWQDLTTDKDFGAVENEITECTYKYKKTNENEYIDGETIITPTISNGKFSAELLIKGDEDANGFNINNSYDILVYIKDKIKESTYSIILGSGSPGMAIHRNGVSFGGPYDESNGGRLQIEGENIVTEFLNTISEAIGDLKIGTVGGLNGASVSGNYITLESIMILRVQATTSSTISQYSNFAELLPLNKMPIYGVQYIDADENYNRIYLNKQGKLAVYNSGGFISGKPIDFIAILKIVP